MEINKIVTSPKVFSVAIEGIGGILFNRPPDMSQHKAKSSKQAKQDKVDVERLNWRRKLYHRGSEVSEVNGEYFVKGGEIIMPGETLHEMLKGAARYWGATIPGDGKKTYTDVIKRSVVCDDLLTGIAPDDEKRVVPFGKNVNGNPSAVKKSLVYSIRPLVQPWGGEFRVHVFDARITVDVLQTLMTYAGMYGGLGDWRPQYGRFNLISLKEVGNAGHE